MKTFSVFYNNGVTDNLSFPNTEDETKNTIATIEERLKANWNQIEAAKVLEGLVVLSRQKAIGTLCVSGPQEKVDQLKTFLEEKNLGTVSPNEAIFRGA